MSALEASLDLNGLTGEKGEAEGRRRKKEKSCNGKMFRMFLVFWGWNEQRLVLHVDGASSLQRGVFLVEKQHQRPQHQPGQH